MSAGLSDGSMDYIVVSVNDAPRRIANMMRAKVKEKIAEGWSPKGGICITRVAPNEADAYQAMVKATFQARN